MKQRCGVARTHVHARDTGIVGVAVAIPAKQAALRSFLMFVTLGLHPTTAVVDLVITKAEHVDHALAIDKDVILAA